MATSEAGKKFKFICDEIEGYLFDIKRAMDIYEGLVRREHPASADEVRMQFDAMLERIGTLRDAGKSMELPDALIPLRESVTLCRDTLKRVRVGVNQFSQTRIHVEPH